MYISVRDGHLPGVFGTIKAGLDAMGIDAIELEYDRSRTVYSLDTAGARESLADKAAIEAYGYKCTGLKCRIAAILLHNNFGAQDLDAEIDWVISGVKAAGQLGVKAMRIDAIMQDDKDLTLDQRTQHFADCMKKVLDATSSLDVQMGIENHGRLGNTPDFLDLVLNKVNSPRLGVTVDTANFYWYGHPVSKVHEIIKHFAPRTKHTHIKNINYPRDQRDIQREVGWEYGKYCSPLREGDLDLKWVVKVLREAGYKGDLCIENESLGRFDEAKRKLIMIDDANFLKEALKAK